MKSDTLSSTLRMDWDLPLAGGIQGFRSGVEGVCVHLHEAFLQK